MELSPKEAFEFLQRRHRVVETEGDVETKAWQVLKESVKEKKIVCAYFDGGVCGHPNYDDAGEVNEDYCSKCPESKRFE